jgi:glycosyltransferase involved in cell wall biosynthesis
MSSDQEININPKKLFIYIPTYNRPKSLEKQIASLSLQVISHKDDVRVLVNDNASPTNSFFELEKQYSAPNIVFHKNSGNIGGNANIALGFAFAKKDEFLWILSDDDILLDNAIENILTNLQDNVDFININRNLQENQLTKHNWADGYSGILVTGGVGLISQILYNMRNVSPYIENAFFFHNSSFPHLAVILALIKDKQIADFLMLPSRYIFNPLPVDVEHLGDYSFSLVGMPLLVSLLNKKAARKFCFGWLSEYGERFHALKSKHHSQYIQTRAVIIDYGVIGARIILIVTWLIYNFNFIANSIKTKCKTIIKACFRIFNIKITVKK